MRQATIDTIAEVYSVSEGEAAEGLHARALGSFCRGAATTGALWSNIARVLALAHMAVFWFDGMLLMSAVSAIGKARAQELLTMRPSC